MSRNETIYSGISAHPAAEVASELYGHYWDLDADSWGQTFSDLVGAVVTLAREVARITPVVVDHDNGPAQGRLTVDAATSEQQGYKRGFNAGRDIGRLEGRREEQGILDYAQAGQASRADQLELVYAGLRELTNMIDFGKRSNTGADEVLAAVQARLFAMLDTGGH